MSVVMWYGRRNKICKGNLYSYLLVGGNRKTKTIVNILWLTLIINNYI